MGHGIHSTVGWCCLVLGAGLFTIGALRVGLGPLDAFARFIVAEVSNVSLDAPGAWAFLSGRVVSTDAGTRAAAGLTRSQVIC